MPNNAAHDTRTTIQANRLAQAVGLNVAARAAASVPSTPSGLLVQYDFAAGDTQSTPSVNEIGFSFGGSRAIAQAPNGELGLEFGYSGSDVSNGWREQRYSLGTGLFENYERWSLWIPANFEHRKLTRLTLAAGQTATNWVRGDLVTGANGSSQGLFHYTDGEYLWLNYAQAFWADSVWVGTITNTDKSLTVDTTARTFAKPHSNNKFSLQWAGNYSRNAMVIEYNPEAANLVAGNSFFDAKSTGVVESDQGPIDGNSGTTGMRPSDLLEGSPPDIDITSDLGFLHDFVIRRRRSSSLAAEDGIIQIWKNGVKIYERLDFPLFDVGANVFTDGYILGYANSGFDVDTTFYLTKFELYGDTPPGITV